MWILSNVTPYSLMLRAHSFKDVQQKINDLEFALRYEKMLSRDRGENFDFSEKERELENLKKSHYDNLNMGVFNYPILMAADILGYGIDGVPVGKDQIQHLEMTRDMARNFNKIYQTDIFVEPEAIIAENVATLPGIDGRKMSKSYDNFIGVFDEEKVLKKRVMSIVSGSEGIDEKKKNPDECHILNLYKIFASEAQIMEMRKKYDSENIGFGYGHAKTMLFEVLMEYLRPYREAREIFLKNPEKVEQKLAE